MNKICIAGQAISSTNYATQRHFNFNPEKIQDAAENFLASGVSELEIPEAVADPDNRFAETTRLDEEKIEASITRMPAETKVTGTYLGGGGLGSDSAAYLRKAKQRLTDLMRYFPELQYAMLHPPGRQETDDPKFPAKIVEVWKELAEFAAEKRTGFECCLHNHYDGACETADQVRAFLDALAEADSPALRWGPDTGHCHGMGDAYLNVFATYAHLIGNRFHIKARVPAFDMLHSGDGYDPERDIWGNKAERGRGLYGGFVNVADPEIETPFQEIFAIIREKAQPSSGIVTGAVEIDVPRQHPRLEAMCSVLYLTTVHGLETGQNLDCETLVRRVFKVS